MYSIRNKFSFSFIYLFLLFMSFLHSLVDRYKAVLYAVLYRISDNIWSGYLEIST